MAKERIYKGESLLEFPEDFIVIDIETTGFSPEKDAIIDIGAIKIKNGSVADTFHSFVNPGDVEVPYSVEELTGLDSSLLEIAPPLEKVLPKFLKFIGSDILVGHNINFDINFLYDKVEKYLGKYLENNFVDTLKISRKLLPFLEHHSLEDVAEFLDVDYEDAHKALSDCKITCLCYLKMKALAENANEKENKMNNKRDYDEELVDDDFMDEDLMDDDFEENKKEVEIKVNEWLEDNNIDSEDWKSFLEILLLALKYEDSEFAYVIDQDDDDSDIETTILDSIDIKDGVITFFFDKDFDVKNLSFEIKKVELDIDIDRDENAIVYSLEGQGTQNKKKSNYKIVISDTDVWDLFDNEDWTKFKDKLSDAKEKNEELHLTIGNVEDGECTAYEKIVSSRDADARVYLTLESGLNEVIHKSSIRAFIKRGKYFTAVFERVIEMGDDNKEFRIFISDRPESDED